MRSDGWSGVHEDVQEVDYDVGFDIVLFEDIILDEDYHLLQDVLGRDRDSFMREENKALVLSQECLAQGISLVIDRLWWW